MHNQATRQWTRIESRKMGPTGHEGLKGHAVALIASSLFVFGGAGRSSNLWKFGLKGEIS